MIFFDLFKPKVRLKSYNENLSDYHVSEFKKLSTDQLQYIYTANTAYDAALPDPDEIYKLDYIEEELEKRVIK